VSLYIWGYVEFAIPTCCEIEETIAAVLFKAEAKIAPTSWGSSVFLVQSQDLFVCQITILNVSVYMKNRIHSPQPLTASNPTVPHPGFVPFVISFKTYG
jgi:hypothetical protein